MYRLYNHLYTEGCGRLRLLPEFGGFFHFRVLNPHERIGGIGDFQYSLIPDCTGETPRGGC